MANNLNRVEKLVLLGDLNVSTMYNKDRKLQFIQDNFGLEGMTDTYIKYYIKIFNQLGKAEHEYNTDMFDFGITDFINLFEYFKWGSNSISNKKSLIKSYLNWGFDNKLISIDVIRNLERVNNDSISKRDVFEQYYFKDFDSLKQALDKKVSDLKLVDNEQLDIAKIAVYLAWFGIKSEEICEIKKEDINEKHSQIYVSSRNLYIDIPKDIMFEIVSYRDSSGYMTNFKNNNNVFSGYADSLILMRSIQHAKLEYTYLSTKISKYFGNNDSIDDGTDKIITYQKVYLSGLFYRAHEYEKENKSFKSSDTEVMSEVFQKKFKSVSASSTMKTQYENYCEHFFPRES